MTAFTIRDVNGRFRDDAPRTAPSSQCQPPIMAAADPKRSFMASGEGKNCGV